MREQEARASWRGRVDDELTGAERLVAAILDHRIVHFRYQGHDRTVEPHLLGLHEAGEPMLLAYQTAGGSNSGQIPGWRSFRRRPRSPEAGGSGPRLRTRGDDRTATKERSGGPASPPPAPPGDPDGTSRG